MALAYRIVTKNCYQLHNVSKLVTWSIGRNDTVRILASGICNQNSYFHSSILESKQINLVSLRPYSTVPNPNDKSPQDNEVKKEGLVTKLKQMYKDYWYVVLPVHMVTSCVWFGCFYYTVRSGVDVLGLLQTIGVSETILTPLRDSSAGYVALAFALYKLVTPVRYAVTVGGTTYAIKKLTAMGLLKPVPSRERLKEIYHEKKVSIQDRFNESKQHYNTLKEKRLQIMEDMKRYKAEVRSMKNKVKKT